MKAYLYNENNEEIERSYYRTIKLLKASKPELLNQVIKDSRWKHFKGLIRRNFGKGSDLTIKIINMMEELETDARALGTESNNTQEEDGEI